MCLFQSELPGNGRGSEGGGEATRPFLLRPPSVAPFLSSAARPLSGRAPPFASLLIAQRLPDQHPVVVRARLPPHTFRAARHSSRQSSLVIAHRPPHQHPVLVQARRGRGRCAVVVSGLRLQHVARRHGTLEGARVVKRPAAASAAAAPAAVARRSAREADAAAAATAAAGVRGGWDEQSTGVSTACKARTAVATAAQDGVRGGLSLGGGSEAALGSCGERGGGFIHKSRPGGGSGRAARATIGIDRRCAGSAVAGSVAGCPDGRRALTCAWRRANAAERTSPVTPCRLCNLIDANVATCRRRRQRCLARVRSHARLVRSHARLVRSRCCRCAALVNNRVLVVHCAGATIRTVAYAAVRWQALCCV
eukprot:364822-Chlamydomonas_euryale.AAC.11